MKTIETILLTALAIIVMGTVIIEAHSPVISASFTLIIVLVFINRVAINYRKGGRTKI
jgi:hypothetical protein